MNNYQPALICKNGHVITDMLRSFPHREQPYCEKCGAETIKACTKCGEYIRGMEEGSGIYHYDRPTCCGHCGSQFPWTVTGLTAAKELAAEIEELGPEGQELLIASLDDLVVDSAKTPVAAVRFKKAMKTTGTATLGMFKEILTDVVSETARKLLWPD